MNQKLSKISIRKDLLTQMCKTCTISTNLSVYVKESQYDPTRTLTLRSRMVSDMNARFNRLKQQITKAIVEQDVFGLKQPAEIMPRVLIQSTPPRQAFAFPRSQDKVSAFMTWFRGQSERELLTAGTRMQIGTGIQQEWTNIYVEDSYKRGVMRANYEMRKAGYTVPGIEQQGGIDAIMGGPLHLDRVGVLYSRVYSDLQGITAAMDSQISRVLSQGMIDGDGPALLARKLRAVVGGGGEALGITDTLGRYIPAQRRAMVLARTEIIRAHHLGTVQEYRNWGVEGVRVKAEFRTAGDGRVCERCASMEGRVYTLDQIEGMIPVHPQCRCLGLPKDVTDDKKLSKGSGKAPPTKAIKQPLENPIPKEFRKGGEWAGDGVEFDPAFFEMVKKYGDKRSLRDLSKVHQPAVAQSTQGAYYNPNTHTIHFQKNERYAESLLHRKRVVYHEYGHAVDWAQLLKGNKIIQEVYNRNINSLNFAKIQEQLDYFARVSRGGRSTHLLKKYGVKNFADMEDMLGAVADTVKAMNPKYGWGHSTEYFSNFELRYAEFIAHAFENKYMGNAIFKEIMPGLYDDMIKMLDKILK